MRISDWSSDVCSSDLTLVKAICPVGRPPICGDGQARRMAADQSNRRAPAANRSWRLSARQYGPGRHRIPRRRRSRLGIVDAGRPDRRPYLFADALRSEEHTSELQSLMRISYAVFCLKKKNTAK